MVTLFRYLVGGCNFTNSKADYDANKNKSNVATDSTGYGGGGTCHPTEWFLGDLWNNCGSDVRGSEEMIQRNLYQSGGKPWRQAIDEAKALYESKKRPVIRMPIFIKSRLMIRSLFSRVSGSSVRISMWMATIADMIRIGM